ncbi:MAG: DUF4032 domain-containing protein [Verrucomicrobiales bacterium]|nr:DUF4032 domain-containing protein [Verrucomicrobiales bacterium]
MPSPRVDALLKDKKVSRYQEFLLEREELMRHKWIMSESHGRDVGFEVALTDWVQHHRHQWRSERNAKLSAD